MYCTCLLRSPVSGPDGVNAACPREVEERLDREHAGHRGEDEVPGHARQERSFHAFSRGQLWQ